jgi:hypothetical protein
MEEIANAKMLDWKVGHLIEAPACREAKSRIGCHSTYYRITQTYSSVFIRINLSRKIPAFE